MYHPISRTSLSRLVRHISHAAALSAAGLVVTGAGGISPAKAQVPAIPQGFGQPGSGPAAQIMRGSSITTVVPYEMWNGLIVVNALFGPGLPETAVINTGLPMCIVMPDLAAKKSMKVEGSHLVSVMDHSVRVGATPPQSIRIESLVLTGVPFGVFDLFTHLSGEKPAQVPPLWLGTSLLEALSITIDPQKQTLTLRPANSPPPPKSVSVPFNLRDGRIWIDVKINDKQNFEAMVDTGAVTTLLPASVAKTLALQPAETVEVVDPNGKPAKIGTARLPDLGIGKTHVKDVHALFVLEGDPAGFNKDFAIIGNDVLLRYRTTIDYGRKTIAFETLPPPPGEKKDAKPKADSVVPPVKPAEKPAEKPKEPEKKPKEGTEKKEEKPRVKIDKPKVDPVTGDPPPAL
jgi:hypothetical protein